MKKVILIASLAIALLAKTSKAQTIVSAGGVTIKLTTEQISYLHRFKSSMLDSALKRPSIKYNTTADVIIMLLKGRKPAKDTALIARKKD